MEGVSAVLLEVRGLTGDMGIGSQQVPMTVLWKSKVALQPRQREALDGKASRPDGGQADTRRGQPPGKVKGRPSRQGGARPLTGLTKHSLRVDHLWGGSNRHQLEAQEPRWPTNPR